MIAGSDSLFELTNCTTANTINYVVHQPHHVRYSTKFLQGNIFVMKESKKVQYSLWKLKVIH